MFGGSIGLRHRQFALSPRPICKNDRNFCHFSPGTVDPDEDFFEDRVAIAFERVRPDRGKRGDAVTAERSAAIGDGQIELFDGKAIDQPAHPTPSSGPSLDAPPWTVPRPYGDVQPGVRGDESDQIGDRLGCVAEVAIEVDEVFVASLDGVLQRGPNCPAQSPFGSAQHADPGVAAGRFDRPLAGLVRRVVINHQQVGGRHGRENPGDEFRQIVPFVVGADCHQERL